MKTYEQSINELLDKHKEIDMSQFITIKTDRFEWFDYIKKAIISYHKDKQNNECLGSDLTYEINLDAVNDSLFLELVHRIHCYMSIDCKDISKETIKEHIKILNISPGIFSYYFSFTYRDEDRPDVFELPYLLIGYDFYNRNPAVYSVNRILEQDHNNSKEKDDDLDDDEDYSFTGDEIDDIYNDLEDYDYEIKRYFDKLQEISDKNIKDGKITGILASYDDNDFERLLDDSLDVFVKNITQGNVGPEAITYASERILNYKNPEKAVTHTLSDYVIAQSIMSHPLLGGNEYKKDINKIINNKFYRDDLCVYFVDKKQLNEQLKKVDNINMWNESGAVYLDIYSHQTYPVHCIIEGE